MQWPSCMHTYNILELFLPFVVVAILFKVTLTFNKCLINTETLLPPEKQNL